MAAEVKEILIFRADSGNTIALESDEAVLFFDMGCNELMVKNGNSDNLVTTINKYLDTCKQRNKKTYLMYSHNHEDHKNIYVGKTFDGRSFFLMNTTLDDDIKNAIACCSGTKSVDFNTISAEFPNVTIFSGISQPPCFPGFRGPNTEIEKNRHAFDDNVGFNANENRRNMIETNDGGVMLHVNMKDNKNNSHSIILPGDRSYYSWPDDALLDMSNVEVLIAPHHGRFVYANDKVFRGGSNNKNKVYIISCSYYPDAVKDTEKPDGVTPATKKNPDCKELYVHKTFMDSHINNPVYKSTASLDKSYEYVYSITATSQINVVEKKI